MRIHLQRSFNLNLSTKFAYYRVLYHRGLVTYLPACLLNNSSRNQSIQSHELRCVESTFFLPNYCDLQTTIFKRNVSSQLYQDVYSSTATVYSCMFWGNQCYLGIGKFSLNILPKQCLVTYLRPWQNNTA